MKSDRELRIFIREVIAEHQYLHEDDLGKKIGNVAKFAVSAAGSVVSGIARDGDHEENKVEIGTKLSDKEGGTPVAVIVGFMDDGDDASIVLGTSSKTPIAKVYSQALGNTQFKIPSTLVAPAAIKTSYNYDPVQRGTGRYLTVQEIKNSTFRYDMNTDEGNWLATFLSAAGNIGALASVDTKSMSYALKVMDITREEDDAGSVSVGTFFNASQLFVPYLDKLHSPQFRYTKDAQSEKASACLLTNQEFISKLPGYVASLAGGLPSSPGDKLYLSALDFSRMSICVQQGTQGVLYKLATLAVSAIMQRFGIPMAAGYGVMQILPAIGPMAYHASTGNYKAFAAYIFQIAAEIAAVTASFTPKGICLMLTDLMCSLILDEVSKPETEEKIKSIIDTEDPQSAEELISIARALRPNDNLDPQDLKSLVPSL